MALRTTAVSVRKQLIAGTADLSLCHGAGGNADILNGGAGLTSTSDHTVGELTMEVAEWGAAAYARDGFWPLRQGAGAAPGLMLGRAGVGSFYLRVADPGESSPLFTRTSQSPPQVPGR